MRSCAAIPLVFLIHSHPSAAQTSASGTRSVVIGLGNDTIAFERYRRPLLPGPPRARGICRCRLLLASAAILAGCERGEVPITEQQRRVVIASVDSATRAFESAQRELDPERVVAHLAPEFYMHADGQRIGYDSVVKNIRRDFSTARYVEPGFQAIDVLVLSPGTALASFRYRDSVVAADGALRRFRGATTLAWTRRGTGWLIVYAHADHEEDRVP